MKGTKRTNALICITWAVPSSIAIVIYLMLHSKTYCIIWPDNDQFRSFPRQIHYVAGSTVFHFIFASTYIFVFFSLLMLDCYMYIRIYLVMRNRTNLKLNSSVDTESQLRQVIVMIIVNGIVFFICCFCQILPQIFLIIYNTMPDSLEQMTFVFIGLAANTFQGVYACIHPLLYLAVNERYRSAFKMVILKCKDRGYQQNHRHKDRTIGMEVINTC